MIVTVTTGTELVVVAIWVDSVVFGDVVLSVARSCCKINSDELASNRISTITISIVSVLPIPKGASQND